MIIQYYTKKNIATGGSIVDNVNNFTYDKNIDKMVIFRQDKEPLMIDAKEMLNFIVAN